jgi:conjugal transfer mating pair stabilization protein TraN
METKCTQGVQCSNQDPGFSTSNTIVFSSELDICVANSQHDCPTNYDYNGLPVAMCESAINCTGGGAYNPESNQCAGEAGICPLGSQYACRGEQGATQCSPNTCFDLSVAGTDVDDSSPDDLMLKGDGDVDDEGNCLDRIYIFSGTGSRCRPPGVTVGTMNNCCDSDEPVMSDAKTGNRISQSISAITTAYEVGQVAYYGSALATGSASIVAVSGTTGAITTMTVVTAGGATTTLTGAAATGAYGALASGATTTAGAVSAGMQSYAVALFNPATIAFAAAAYVAVKILMGNGCDQRDIMTAMLRDSGNCHYLGKMCDRRWTGIGCVQRLKRYCCFNSKMGRIIHEQGRPQLKSFGPDGAWGTPNEPNCRGFTTEEFQMLDFSKIDMSEYFADMQKGLQQQIQDSQQKTMDKVQQHYQQAL